MIRKAPWLKSVRLIDIIVDKILEYRPYIPFTAPNSVWRSLDKRAKSILDVGCGKGQPMTFINRRKQFTTVGIDLFQPYLKEVQSHCTHDNYVLCDARQLPFKQKSFDVVLCLEVLEHLEKEDGERFLQAIEAIARRQVVLSSPVGEYHQEAFDFNPHQHHKSEWTPLDLRRKNYRVIGVGVRGLGGDSGLTSKLPRVLRPLHYIVWLLAGPVVHYIPSLGGHMIAVKRVDQE